MCVQGGATLQSQTSLAELLHSEDSSDTALVQQISEKAPQVKLCSDMRSTPPSFITPSLACCHHRSSLAQVHAAQLMPSMMMLRMRGRKMEMKRRWHKVFTAVRTSAGRE